MDSKRQAYAPAPSPTYPLAAPTALPLVPAPQLLTIILNTLPVTNADDRKIEIPKTDKAGTRDEWDNCMNFFATNQYIMSATAPSIPPNDMLNRVPNLSAHKPGIQLNKPAKKKAVEIVSNSLADNPSDRFKSAPYNPKA